MQRESSIGRDERRSGAAGRIGNAEHNDKSPVLSVAEYRKLLNDYVTSDERVTERIEFFERFIGNIIAAELERYV
jgi:hypothetical protein